MIAVLAADAVDAVVLATPMAAHAAQAIAALDLGAAHEEATDISDVL